PRLVEDDVALRGVELDRRPVELDTVPRPHAGPELGDPAVDGDAPLGDEALDDPAGGDASGRERLLQALALGVSGGFGGAVASAVCGAAPRIPARHAKSPKPSRPSSRSGESFGSSSRELMPSWVRR